MQNDHVKELPSPDFDKKHPLPGRPRVFEPEKRYPPKVRSAYTGKVRRTRLGDFEEVWDHACMLKASFVTDNDIRREIIFKFGLDFPLDTYANMNRLKTYAPRIDRYRKKYATSKVRGIPNAYRFKRLQKLSDAFEKTWDPKELSLLDECIRRNMDKIENVLFESEADQELTPQAKKQLLLQTALKLLGDPTANVKGLEDKILEVAQKIKRERDIKNAKDIKEEP